MSQRNTKKTTEEFIEEMSKVNPNIEILGEYVNNITKILVRDKRCGHEWDTSNPKGLLKGGACPKCAHIRKKKRENTTNRLGEIKYNTEKEKMQIVKYRKANDIDVEFEDGTIVKNKRYSFFSKGLVFNPYRKSVYGVGYLGDGEYSPINEKYITTKEYERWRGMLERCYDEKFKERHPAYKECSVVEEWYNFQNFAKWYSNNYYEIEGQQMHLDKDILVKGNKVYSPDNCMIVPQVINILFVNCKSVRGDYPVGVTLTTTNKFRARCNNELLHERIHIGVFATPEDAFYKGYKPYKENHIKEVADYYRDQIPDKLYKAMYNWVVEITD